jgi:chitin synthase
MLGRTLDAQTVASSMQCANAICVTVYNESGELFRNTLDALVHSIGRFHGQAANRDSYSTICVIIDGRERMQQSLYKLLLDGGLLGAEPARDERGDEYHVTKCKIAAAAGLFGDGNELIDASGTMRFIVCVKAENRGKLESHHIFFNTLCVNLNPRYCYQVDTGTTLHPDVMLNLHRAFERDPHLAGLAPSVLLPTPRIDASILESWQYCDFAYRNSVGWPFEVLGGYLSVLPGQASAVRWHAMLPRKRNAAYATTPLATYLRGLSVHGPFERLMYLAEDRVIGGEIIFSRGECTRLDYADAAKATTDPCISYSELFRQRRRWANSTLACRIWLMRRWPEWIRRADRSIAEKLHFSIALVVQSGFSLTEYLAPALWLALIAMLASASPPGATFVLPAMLTCTAIELALVGVVNSHQRTWSRIGGVAAAVTANISCGLYLYFLCRLPFTVAGFLLIPAFALLPMLRVIPRKGWARMVTARFSPITYVFFISMLCAYAVFRLDDVSWGTRGLTKSDSAAVQARQLRKIRNYSLAIWGSINAAAATLAFTKPGFLVSSLNPVVEIFCALEFVIAMGAALFFVMRRRAPRVSAKPAIQARPERASSPS